MSNESLARALRVACWVFVVGCAAPAPIRALVPRAELPGGGIIEGVPDFEALPSMETPWPGVTGATWRIVVPPSAAPARFRVTDVWLLNRGCHGDVWEAVAVEIEAVNGGPRDRVVEARPGETAELLVRFRRQGVWQSGGCGQGWAFRMRVDDGGHVREADAQLHVTEATP